MKEENINLVKEAAPYGKGYLLLPLSLFLSLRVDFFYFRDRTRKEKLVGCTVDTRNYRIILKGCRFPVFLTDSYTTLVITVVPRLN